MERERDIDHWCSILIRPPWQLRPPVSVKRPIRFYGRSGFCFGCLNPAAATAPLKWKIKHLGGSYLKINENVGTNKVFFEWTWNDKRHPIKNCHVRQLPPADPFLLFVCHLQLRREKYKGRRGLQDKTLRDHRQQNVVLRSVEGACSAAPPWWPAISIAAARCTAALLHIDHSNSSGSLDVTSVVAQFRPLFRRLV